MKYEFENSQVRFDGTQKQADALKKRAEALGYKLGSGLDFWLGDDMYLIIFITGKFGFYGASLFHTPKQTYNEFMQRTEKYINAPTPKPYPCQAHDDQTNIVEIDGEKWRVELIEKVIEPLSAKEFYQQMGSNDSWYDEMQAYAEYRIEFYKKHGI